MLDTPFLAVEGWLKELIKKLLLLLQSAVTVVYLLRGKFTTAQSAGFTSPLALEPGPGNLVRAVDTSNLGSVVSDSFTITGTAFVNNSDPAYYFTNAAGSSFDRAAGLTVIFRISPTGIVNIMWTNNIVPTAATCTGVRTDGTNLIYSRNGNVIVIGTDTNGAEHLIALTLTTGGIEMRVRGGVYSEWSLIFPETGYSTTPLWPALTISTTATAVLSDIYINQPVGRLATGSQIVSQSSPDTTILTGVANALVQLTATVPAGAGGNLIELRYREADANNYSLARVQWNGSNYELVTGHVISGVETLQGSPIASVVAAGNTLRLMVRANGNSHEFWTTGGSTWTKRYAVITDASGASNVGVSVRNVSFTSTSLLAWDYQDAEIATALSLIASQ